MRQVLLPRWGGMRPGIIGAAMLVGAFAHAHAQSAAAAAPAVAPPPAVAAPPAVATPGGVRDRPLVELGIGGGAGWVPDYPAADQGRFRGILVPYLIYRGELLRSDEEGARARARLSDGIELSLSASGSLPVSSSDNTARRGMPDLDWLGEIGPTLRMTLWQSPRATRPRRVLLDTPIRAVFSSDWSSVEFRGFTFSPTLAWEERDLLRPDSRLRLSVAPIFATGRFMEYFYSVGQPYVLPDRPAYDANGGYLGTRLQASWRMKLTRWLTLVAGGRVENFSGATNAGSPLFRSEWNAAAAIGLSVALWRSDAMVPSAAEPFD